MCTDQADVVIQEYILSHMPPADRPMVRSYFASRAPKVRRKRGRPVNVSEREARVQAYMWLLKARTEREADGIRSNPSADTFHIRQAFGLNENVAQNIVQRRGYSKERAEALARLSPSKSTT